MNKTATLLLLCTILCLAACEQEEGKFKDPRDKKIYKTVKIGEQVWMAENLNYKYSANSAYSRGMSYDNEYVYGDFGNKSNDLHSIRCLKD